MTEQQYQAARKVMQSANYIRGLITKYKREVATWTALEDGHRRKLNHGQADGCKKMIEKYINFLQKARQRFKDLRFPEEDTQPTSRWIAAIDVDSYNYLPKEIQENDFEKAKDEGLEMHPTKAAAQNECDLLNAL